MVKIDGTQYVQDVVLHVDGRITLRETELSLPYRADYFHVPLSENEVRPLLAERPEVVIIGAGFKGMLSLTPGAKALLEGVETHILTTDRALELLNREERGLVAVLHLTC